MAGILFLAHRIPYPPNKGDKIRSWNLLSHLLRHHTVHLGFFVDDEKDMDHIPFLEDQCASLCFEKVDPRLQRIKSLSGLATGHALTVSAYPYGSLRAYSKKLLNKGAIDLVFLFSAATGPILPNDNQTPVLLDLVDVDSQKWLSYGKEASWPLSWVYAREGKKLGLYEQQLTQKAKYTALVSEQEADLFKSLCPSQSSKIKAIPNGVDLDQFKASRNLDDDSVEIVVFTGAMDYQPNIEAVVWFVNAIWPTIKAQRPNAIFRIAGGPAAKPVLELRKTASVEVLGYVDDMAEQIAKATICIAPLRTARGIQNKVLEAMAMSKAIVTTSLANEGINAECGTDLMVADKENDFSDAVVELLVNPEKRAALGSNARKYVERNFTWDQAFKQFDELIGECL